MAEEFQVSKQKFEFDHLIVKFSESTQKQQPIENKLTSFVKETLYIPIISSEIRVERQSKEIEKKYKSELENREIHCIRINIPLRDEEKDDDEW